MNVAVSDTADTLYPQRYIPLWEFDVMRCLLLCLLCVSAGAMAENVYKCVDGAGRVTYTQAACPSDSQVSTIPLQTLPDTNGYRPPPRPYSPAPVVTPTPVTVVPDSSTRHRAPDNDITIVGGSSSQSSFRQESEVRGSGIRYQPVPVYIDRRPRDDTWRPVPHPQATPPTPPTPPVKNGIPIDR